MYKNAWFSSCGETDHAAFGEESKNEAIHIETDQRFCVGGDHDTESVPYYGTGRNDSGDV